MKTSGVDSVLPVIGVFDSGVGGLSIFTAVQARVPGARYFYCSDNAHFPYGVRTDEDVTACTLQATSRFIAKCGVDILVVACNTASTIALPHLRAQYQIPVVGVVPAIKPAAQMSRSGTIALLATPATVQRPYTDELIQTFAAGRRVLRLGSSRMVQMAEDKLRGHTVDIAELRAELAPLFAQSPPEPQRRLDTVVLGCTHFPLLVPELTAAAPWDVQWIDSSQAIAARVEYLLVEQNLDAHTLQTRAAPVAYFTAPGPLVEDLRPAFERLGFRELGIV